MSKLGPIAVLVSGVAIMAALGGASNAGLRVNTSVSMPMGLWRTSPLTTVLKRSSVVTVCLPATALTKLAEARGYIGPGSCPSGVEPLVKNVAAVPGDVVTASLAGLSVNGHAIPNTVPLPYDSAHRALSAMRAGSYVVPAGQAWIVGDGNPKSFDSRYMGGVPISGITETASPLWVVR